jgi:hypothetical protein
MQNYEIDITNNEVHVLVAWPNAQKHLKYIKSIIEKYFTKFIEFPVDINNDLLIIKISKMYDLTHDEAVDRIKVCGFGKFSLFVVEDRKPHYQNIWRFGTGYTKTNTSISKCKNELREFLKHPFLLHSSNDQIEAKNNLRILLGSILNNNILNINEILTNNSEVFSFLNDVDDYLILRDFSPGDIDVLTRKTPKQYARLLGANHERLRFLNFNKDYPISPIDVVNVHHGIFCPIWCENMLTNKEFDNLKKVYRPNKEDLLFSLMYHYTLHKREIPELGKSLMNKIIIELGYKKLENLNYDNKRDCVYHLLKFLKKHNYSVPNPKDPKMYFDSNVAKYLRKKLYHEDLIYDPQKEIDFKKQIENLNLFDLAKNVANQYFKQKLKCVGIRRYNNICSTNSLMDTGFFEVTINANGAVHEYYLKIYYSEYKIILDSLTSSLTKSIKLSSQFLNTPIKLERHGKFMLSLEPFIRGKRIDEYIYENREKLTDKKIEQWLTSLKSSLKNANINHCDIHSRNIIISQDENVALLDFKTIKSNSERKISPITCFKSAPDDDNIAIEIVSGYLKNLLKGSELKGIYNPKIIPFIQKKFEEKFSKFNKNIKSGKVTIENFEKHVLENLEKTNASHLKDNLLDYYSKEEQFLFDFAETFATELHEIRLSN